MLDFHSLLNISLLNFLQLIWSVGVTWEKEGICRVSQHYSSISILANDCNQDVFAISPDDTGSHLTALVITCSANKYKVSLHYFRTEEPSTRILIALLQFPVSRFNDRVSVVLYISTHKLCYNITSSVLIRNSSRL